MNRKALLVAAAAAIVGVVLLAIYKKRFEDEASGGPPTEVIVARTTIRLGDQIKPEMIVARPLPQSYVENRHIPWSDRESIIGLRVTSEIHANESLLWSDVPTSSDQGRDLSSLVRPGMRAITINSDQTTSFGGLIQAGDRVDALLTITQPGQNGQSGGPVTLSLLQNLMVLAAGRDLGGARPRAESGNGQNNNNNSQINQVTLSVTVEQGQLLAFARDRGKLTLVMRNPDDINEFADLPQISATDINDAERRRVIADTRPRTESTPVQRTQRDRPNTAAPTPPPTGNRPTPIFGNN